MRKNSFGFAPLAIVLVVFLLSLTGILGTIYMGREKSTDSPVVVFTSPPKTNESASDSASPKETVTVPTPTQTRTITPTPPPLPPPVSSSSSPQTTKKIQLLIFNPTLENQNNIRLVDFKHWNDPESITSQIISDFKQLSGGYVNYEIAEKIVIDGYGEKNDGFNYSDDSYLACMANSSNCHQPDGVNYQKILQIYQSCEKRNSGQIDEVWLWGGPYFGYWESTLAGPNAFWYNSSPLANTSCQKLLPIMGFNYERGPGEAMESYGHRTESALRQAFGGWDSKNGSTPWDNFTRRDIDVPGNANCGNIHFAPASQSDYDWGNARIVKSACDDWLNYPNLPASPNYVDVGCQTWSCDGYGFKKWWFSHLPKTEGTTNGKENNWWKYIVDYESAKK